MAKAHKVRGLPGATHLLWDPSPIRTSGSGYHGTLYIPDDELDEVRERERERKARGFGFAPLRAEPAPPAEPKVWEGDGA